MRWHRIAPVTLAVVLASVLSGCSASGGRRPGTVSVVASTDVWGDVAQQVAGSLAGRTVTVTSVIDDPAQDPHSYEADARTQLAVSRADVVIENGGGYDDFMTALRRASGSTATVLDAVGISGRRAGPNRNEHVWYDLPTVAAVANRIAAALAAKDPAHAGAFRANARAFAARVTALEARERAIRAAHAGTGVAITEPVPLFLLQACGLVNRTPQAFSAAVEEGYDAAPRVLQQLLGLFPSHAVALLSYNAQTSDAQTEAVRSAAEKAGVPTVPVTETLPPGRDYLSWMSANLDAVAAALDHPRK